MHWKDRQQRYTGQWKNHLPNGLGEHTYLHAPPDVSSTKSTTITFFTYNRYVGMFRDGKKHGEGTLFYSNGAVSGRSMLYGRSTLLSNK